MPDAGQAPVRPREAEPSRVDAIVQAYVEEARGDAGAALRLAVTDALAALAELERRTRRAERFVSRGFVRGQIGR